MTGTCLFCRCGKFIIDKDKASIGMLQRVFKIGFNRAARIMDQLVEAGVVGGGRHEAKKSIDVLEEFEQYIEEMSKKQKKGLVADENRYSDCTGSTDGPHQGCGRNSWY